MARRAFTLIELLVVVAIVALLVAILLPALNGAREQGKASVCLSNMRSLGIAVTLYLQTNEDRFPGVGLMHGGQSDAGSSWVQLMLAEYGGEGNNVAEVNGQREVRTQVKDIRRCPSDRSAHWTEPRIVGGRREFRLTSYASNYYLVGPAVNIGKEHPFERLDRVKRPSNTIYWAELAEKDEFAVADHVHPETWFAGDPRFEAGEEVAIERHAKKANYAMIDGHAEPFVFERTYKIDIDSSDIFAGRVVWFANKWDPDVAR